MPAVGGGWFSLWSFFGISCVSLVAYIVESSTYLTGLPFVKNTVLENLSHLSHACNSKTSILQSACKALINTRLLQVPPRRPTAYRPW